MSGTNVTPGKLWHWRVNDNGDWRYLVYTGRNVLYVQKQLVAADRVKFKAKCEALTADLSLLFDGDDAKVDELIAKHDIPRIIRIPYAQLERIELLPFMETQVRIRHSGGKTVKLLFGGDVGPTGFSDELRQAISPAASIGSEEMGAFTAARGPAIAALAFAAFGWVFFTLSTESYRGPNALGKLIEKIAHALGPVTVLILFGICVALCLWVMTNRLRKRPVISFWSVRPA